MKTPRLALAALLALPLSAAEAPAPETLAAQARGLAGNFVLSLQGELFAAMKAGFTPRIPASRFCMSAFIGTSPFS